jgi:hypothetical protein
MTKRHPAAAPLPAANESLRRQGEELQGDAVGVSKAQASRSRTVSAMWLIAEKVIVELLEAWDVKRRRRRRGPCVFAPLVSDCSIIRNLEKATYFGQPTLRGSGSRTIAH